MTDQKPRPDMPSEVWIADVSMDPKSEILEIVDDIYGGTKYRRDDLAAPSQWRDMPKSWHVSWMGEDDGAFLCQIKRHDDDLGYLGDITFVSRKSLVSIQQAYNFAVDEVLKEYDVPLPQPPTLKEKI